ncbi:hypothetical protein TIFTF001_013937 [Ficus carica]|uniref:Uncharacterized protein n=1 Tax=Ficus carica TaxID=3494 RepID=A0AA88A572_FICCA|nr:hypothetical protein TIFTF001_013937 [Ficus carica]
MKGERRTLMAAQIDQESPRYPQIGSRPISSLSPQPNLVWRMESKWIASASMEMATERVIWLKWVSGVSEAALQIGRNRHCDMRKLWPCTGVIAI